MTTNRPPSTATLMRAARVLRFAEMAQGVVRWSVQSATAFLVLILLDNFLHLPQALRLPIGVVLSGFILVELYRKVIAPARRPLTPARAARMLEINRGISGNVLINAYQFEQHQQEGWKKYVAPILASSSSILNDIPARTLWLTPTLKKWLASLVLLLAIWMLLTLFFPRFVTTGIERILLPMADIPPAGDWNIEVRPEGHVQLVEGDKLDIFVRVRAANGSMAKPTTPTLIWQEGTGISESPDNGGERAPMLTTAKPDEFVFSFSTVSQPLSFRVWVDDSRSSAVQVDVSPLPQIKESAFEVTPPPYTGIKAYSQPGPPSTLEVPLGSTAKATLHLSADAKKVVWHEGKTATDLLQTSGSWQINRLIDASSAYDLLLTLPGNDSPHLLGQGQLTAIPDRPPQVDFVTQDRNRAVNPGGKVLVTIRATDDYGVASIALRLASGDDPASARVIKSWTYLGPPGQAQPTPENFTIELDPSVFTPGSTFLLTAQAMDFSPARQKTVSRPIVLRVAGLQDLAVPQGDALEKLFDFLKSTIVQQTQANGLTDNLTLHLAEAVAANDLAQHFGGMTDSQKQAQTLGASALDEAGKHGEGKVYQARLQTLVNGEMGLALGQLNDFPKAAPPNLKAPLAALHNRQAYILDELISLLGQLASERQQAAQALVNKQTTSTPSITTEQELAKLKDQLKAFTDDQKRIIQATTHLKELNPEDLTTDQQAVLGQLAREEANQAKYFQEKLTDLSKLPLQDFADGKLVQDVNEVYQEVQAASADLYQKRVELAVPAEQAGLEKAEEIEQNLERWLPNTPDNIKWSMEEPPEQSDAPMAELPKQLDDLIGDLLKKEQDMDQDKDDVSSSLMDSIDKGAGWGADDGPMSNMSAKGVTGNQLPNNDEIGGRSGEGRNGKSDGEMVGNTAVGKGGNETPTRLKSTPFENGSVNDQSQDTKGGATGGGKLSGTGQEGLRGSAPPAARQRMHVLADQQSKLRQQAESLALQLRKDRRPTGDLESAVAAMKELENGARNQNGLAVVQGYHQALDALESARASYAGDRLSRVETDALTRDPRKDILDSQAEEAPAGYEEMTGAYFRSLGESTSTPASAGTPAAPPPSP